MTIQSRKVTLITLFLLLAGAPNTLFISQESYAGTNKKKTPSQKNPEATIDLSPELSL